MNTNVMYKTYYDLLQVSPTAEHAIIQQAWRVLAQKHHPDQSSADDASSVLTRLNRARDVLLDPLKRIEYDRKLAAQGLVSGTTFDDGDFRRRHSDLHLSMPPSRRATDDSRRPEITLPVGRRVRDSDTDEGE